MPLGSNILEIIILGYKDPKQSIALTRPSSASTPRDLHDDATCTTRSRFSTSLEIKLGNSIPTYFHTEQAARS
jgi:hypothetical protein